MIVFCYGCCEHAEAIKNARSQLRVGTTLFERYVRDRFLRLELDIASDKKLRQSGCVLIPRRKFRDAAAWTVSRVIHP